MTLKKISIVSGLLVAVMLALASRVGILWVDQFEDEGYVEVFLKQKPSLLKFVFIDPHASDAVGEPHAYGGRMDQHGNWVAGTREFNRFATYCEYRYNISISSHEGLGRCRGISRIHNHRIIWPYLIYIYYIR